MTTLTYANLCRLAELIAEAKTLLGDPTLAKHVSIMDIADLARAFDRKPVLEMQPIPRLQPLSIDNQPDPLG